MKALWPAALQRMIIVVIILRADPIYLMLSFVLASIRDPKAKRILDKRNQLASKTNYFFFNPTKLYTYLHPPFDSKYP